MRGGCYSDDNCGKRVELHQERVHPVLEFAVYSSKLFLELAAPLRCIVVGRALFSILLFCGKKYALEHYKIHEKQ